MQLKEKGQSAEIVEKSNDMKITTKWSSDDDFDTAALYEFPNGERGMVYYGSTGNNPPGTSDEDKTHGFLDKPPYIMLDKDSRTGGEENLVVTSKAMELYKRIHLVVWDYKAIRGQKAPSFNVSDLKVYLDEHEVHPHTAPDINFIEMAVIHNDGGKISVINKSIQGSLRNVDDEDMWKIIDKG